MYLGLDKNDYYLQCVQGEEIHIFQMDDTFLEISKFHFSVELGENDFYLHKIGLNSGLTGSIILSLAEAPTRTKRSTMSVMSDFKKENCTNHHFSKELAKAYFGKRKYYCPYITKNSLWIPLEGESRGNVDYINASLMNSLKSYYSDETILSFVNGMETVLPREYHPAKTKFKEYLEYYIAYSYAMFLLNHNEGAFEPFDKWQGNCWKKYDYLISEVTTKLTRQQIYNIKGITDIKYELPDSAVGDLIDRHYNQN